MGIPGIYNEIGAGERVALAKLAVEKLEKSGRPLRLAIDISIWQFQIQSGRGGTNPALRTLYYRLIRLLSYGIQPLFVFDGPHKPQMKRNKNSGRGASVDNHMTKDLLDLFGFPYHMAPGEAEAECAYLQWKGVVDAVLSEDVDTLMFGSTITLRNWSSERASNKEPTHVNLYDAQKTKEGISGLDREGMVLVALMSGGDYTPEGIPGCGIKVACEAARAGFGKELCALPLDDKTGYRQWRERLEYELQTNESKYFRTKHPSLTIPENFPRRKIVGYYVRPVVSSAEKIEQLRNDIRWDKEVNVLGLRIFTARAFDWVFRTGAKKFCRRLAPALLTLKLLKGQGIELEVDQREKYEDGLVKAILSRQTGHQSVDGVPQVRLRYIPLDIVGLDLDQEEDDRDHEAEAAITSSGDEESEVPQTPSKRQRASRYDPTEPVKDYFIETFVKIGVPLKMQDFEETLRNPLPKPKQKNQANVHGGMKKGALDRYVKVTKNNVALVATDKSSVVGSSQDFPPSSQDKPATSTQYHTRSGPSTQSTTTDGPSTPKARRTSSKKAEEGPPVSNNVNPWTLAASSRAERSRRRRAAAHELRIHDDDPFEAIDITSSPQVEVEDMPSQETPTRRRLRFSSPSSPNSFPSPSTFLRPSPSLNKRTDTTISIASSPPASPSRNFKHPARPARSTRTHIVLRESLQGAWKQLEEWEETGNRTVIQAVEVVDLTEI